MLGLFFGVKCNQKGLLKGAVVGGIYSILSELTFGLYAGKSIFSGFNLWDFVFGVICGIISGIIVVNVRK